MVWSVSNGEMIGRRWCCCPVVQVLVAWTTFCYDQNTPYLYLYSCAGYLRIRPKPRLSDSCSNTPVQNTFVLVNRLERMIKVVTIWLYGGGFVHRWRSATQANMRVTPDHMTSNRIFSPFPKPYGQGRIFHRSIHLTGSEPHQTSISFERTVRTPRQSRRLARSFKLLYLTAAPPHISFHICLEYLDAPRQRNHLSKFHNIQFHSYCVEIYFPNRWLHRVIIIRDRDHEQHSARLVSRAFSRAATAF